jgi:hypothetical protein
LRSNFPASRSPKEIFATIGGVQNVHKAENQRFSPRTHVELYCYNFDFLHNSLCCLFTRLHSSVHKAL